MINEKMFWFGTQKKKVYVVTLSSKLYSQESENLAVFERSEEAWEYAESISKDYNKHEWFLLIEEFTVGDASKRPKTVDADPEEHYPCPIEWN